MSSLIVMLLFSIMCSYSILIMVFSHLGHHKLHILQQDTRNIRESPDFASRYQFAAECKEKGNLMFKEG